MAGFGHVAVGFVGGRIAADSSGRKPLLFILAFALLAMLPDFDVFVLLFGGPDRGLWGHRGFFHTPFFALLVGLIAVAVTGGTGKERLRRGLGVALAVGSHCLLDALAQDGRGMMFFWPFTEDRYHFLWRPIPDAPRGLAFFGPVGLRHFAIELVYFLPFTLYAWWPRRLRPLVPATWPFAPRP